MWPVTNHYLNMCQVKSPAIRYKADEIVMKISQALLWEKRHWKDIEKRQPPHGRSPDSSPVTPNNWQMYKTDSYCQATAQCVKQTVKEKQTHKCINLKHQKTQLQTQTPLDHSRLVVNPSSRPLSLVKKRSLLLIAIICHCSKSHSIHLGCHCPQTVPQTAEMHSKWKPMQLYNMHNHPSKPNLCA